MTSAPIAFNAKSLPSYWNFSSSSYKSVLLIPYFFNEFRNAATLQEACVYMHVCAAATRESQWR